MGKKYKNDPLNKTFDIPGPGNYSPERKEHAPAFT